MLQNVIVKNSKLSSIPIVYILKKWFHAIMFLQTK